MALAAEPVLAAFSRARLDVGAFGNGTKLKLVANLLAAVHNVAAAEALAKRGKHGEALACYDAVLGPVATALARRGAPLVGADRFSGVAPFGLDAHDRDGTVFQPTPAPVVADCESARGHLRGRVARC